jgi:hypothetical protein
MTDVSPSAATAHPSANLANFPVDSVKFLLKLKQNIYTHTPNITHGGFEVIKDVLESMVFWVVTLCS